MAESVPIPEPPGLPFIGNLGEFQTSPINDLKRLADTYGKHYSITSVWATVLRAVVLPTNTRR